MAVGPAGSEARHTVCTAFALREPNASGKRPEPRPGQHERQSPPGGANMRRRSAETVRFYRWDVCLERPVCILSSIYTTFFFRAAPAGQEGSQARGRIGATAAGLHHSHSNRGSKQHLRPAPERTDPQPTEQAQGSNPRPHGCWSGSLTADETPSTTSHRKSLLCPLLHCLHHHTRHITRPCRVYVFSAAPPVLFSLKCD